MIEKMNLTFPLWRQLTRRDWTALGDSAKSVRSEQLQPRTRSADQVVKSICPYCAVGCGQVVYVKDGKIIDIEGDPDSPISRGCLCPKGAATFQLVTGSHRVQQVLYRRPHAHRMGDDPARAGHGHGGGARRSARARPAGTTSHTARTMAIAHLGGATLDNEENYLIKKLFTALGIVQIENQARI